MNIKIITLVVIFGIGIFFRFYRLGDIPPGLNPDEASIGYNAYSLLETGKDRYGQTFPIVFRSLGTYLLPVYTYLTIIPVAVFGPTILSVHLVSALSSILIIVLTLLIVFESKRINLANKFLVGFLISISPWAVYFGRAGHEVTLSLAVFIFSIFLFIKSISHPKLIPLTFLMIGLSSYIYYAERYLSLIFFPLLLLVFKDKFIKYKKYLLIGILLWIVSQLPQVPLIHSEAFTRRVGQVNYLNDENSGNLGFKALYILKEFSSHYLEYFSPRSLFFDADPQQARSIPDLSVFYTWMLISFLFGIKIFLKNKADPIFKILLLLLVVTPIPAALTKDPFYSFRVLSFLWVLTILISLGSGYLLELIPKKIIRVILITVIVVTSLASLYNSYFVILKYEREDNYGYEYKELVNSAKNYSNKKFVVDNSRVAAANIWIPFYAKTNPVEYQLQVEDDIKKEYYNNTNMDFLTKVENFEIRPIFWEDDIYLDKILVGDELAISKEQVTEHKLTELFKINGLDGKPRLIAYKTDPKAKCESVSMKNSGNPKCQRFIP